METITINVSDLVAYGTPVVAVLSGIGATFFACRNAPRAARAVAKVAKSRMAAGTTLVLAVLSLLALAGVRQVADDKHYFEAGKYVQKAYEANDPIEASEFFNQAVSYLQENGLTDGFSSALYRDPDYDIGRYYRHMINAQETLNAVAAAHALNSGLKLEGQHALTMLQINTKAGGFDINKTSLVNPATVTLMQKDKVWQSVLTQEQLVTNHSSESVKAVFPNGIGSANNPVLKVGQPIALGLFTLAGAWVMGHFVTWLRARNREAASA